MAVVAVIGVVLVLLDSVAKASWSCFSVRSLGGAFRLHFDICRRETCGVRLLLAEADEAFSGNSVVAAFQITCQIAAF